MPHGIPLRAPAVAALGWRGVIGSALVALRWAMFLVRGGRVPFGVGQSLTLLAAFGWAWIAWGR